MVLPAIWLPDEKIVAVAVAVAVGVAAGVKPEVPPPLGEVRRVDRAVAIEVAGEGFGELRHEMCRGAGASAGDVLPGSRMCLRRN